MKNFQVLIIGGGTAGIMVAARLKKADKNLQIVEEHLKKSCALPKIF